ncbi:hypothetical protein Tco_0833116 [Tanacetum coccineum]
MDYTRIFGNAYDDEDVGAEADLNNLETTMNVSPIPTTRIDKDHPKDQIIGDFNSAIQTRRMTKISDEHAMVCYINKQRRTNHKDYQNCLFACFLSQMEPKKVIQALEDPSILLLNLFISSYRTCTTDPLISQGPKDSEEDSRMKPTEVDVSRASNKDGEDDQALRSEFERLLQQEKQTEHPNITNSINTVSTTHVSNLLGTHLLLMISIIRSPVNEE